MSPRLLVIDDSLTVRKLVELAFRAAEESIEFASSGAEGLAKASSGEPPQAILLDYTLPDMRGTDVCRRLAEDARLSRVPVVLMSGKGPSVREQFAAYPAVVDFIGKPFTREEVARRLRSAASTPPASPSGPAPSSAPAAPPQPVNAAREILSFEQKQAAARALFARLKPALAQIPSWSGQLGDAQPAAFYAKKILSPEIIDQLLEVLVPLSLEAAAAAPLGSTRLFGQLTGQALLDLLRMLEAGRHSGVMELTCAGARLVAYWKKGALLVASSFDPVEYQRDAAASLDGISAEARERAEKEQRASGKPLYATLADEGLMSLPDAQRTMARQGRIALRAALREPSCRLEWRGEAALPPFIEDLGQPIPIAQLWLERLRAVALRDEIEGAVPSSQGVFERGERFSAKVRLLELSGSERRALALVDGRATVQEVIDRSGLSTSETFHVLYRLAEVGLIRRRAHVLARPKVAIFESDAEGIRRPLATFLAGRSRPAELMSLEAVGDPVEAVLRERPALVLLGIEATGAGEAERIARALSDNPSFSGALVAILGADAGGHEIAENALFDAVFVKPFHVSELEALLPS
jgi:CheY-like chemotaxis protein